jgi:hypothetical protein
MSACRVRWGAPAAAGFSWHLINPVDRPCYILLVRTYSTLPQVLATSGVRCVANLLAHHGSIMHDACSRSASSSSRGANKSSA